MFFMENFFSRIADDFRHRELLPLKLLFFVHSSTIYVLYPYLTIHMRELGINVEETAIMSAVTPLVAIIMPPIAGMIADRIGNFKILLSLFSGLGGAAALLLLLVPVGRVSTTFPNNTIVEIGSLNGGMYLKTSEPHLCEKVPKSILDLKMNVEACGLICTHETTDFVPFNKGPKTAEEESSAILGARNYTIYLKSSENTTEFQYVLGPEDLPLYKENLRKDVRNLKLMKNEGSLLTTIRKLSENKYFFPAYSALSFQCFTEDDNFICSTIKSPFSPKTYSVKVNNTGGTIFRKFIVMEMMNEFLNKSSSVTSIDEVDGSSMVAVPLPSVENGLEIDATILIKKCTPKCLATVPRRKICSNLKMQVEYDTNLTFWSYLVVRVFIGMIGGTAFAMFEGAVIAILREHKADYGLQRIYATIGGMISSPLSGWLIDYASSDKQYSDFTPAFYLYAALKIISAFLMLTINLEFKSPAKNVFKDVMQVLKQIEVIALFITCFILGTAWGYLESFLFWLLQDLGASGSLMGITIAVGGIAGLPLLVMSGPIIEKLGHANVLFIGFIFYAIRLAGYSVIYNPWMCLIFEAMESITSALAFTAAVTYAAKLSTPTTDSSIQGLLGGLYFGVGKGAGSLIGGFLMTGVGTRQTYRIFSATTLLTGCIYFLFNHFYISKRPTDEKEKEKDVPKDTNNEKKDLEAIPMSKVISKANNYKTTTEKEENGIVNTGFVLSEEKNENKKL